MKKVYIIHGLGGSSKEPMLDWIKLELEKKGYDVKSFNMPNSEHPKIENWVKYLEDNININYLDEHTYFIGHSIGCQTIMRFLEKLHKHKRIAGCVFIAPWLDLINLEPEELEIAHPWINSKINLERVSDHTGNFTCIFSDNDPHVHLDEVEKFRKGFGAKIIIKKHKGHFTKEDNVKELPEVLEHLK